GVRHFGAHDGDITSVVARRFFLLVGGVMLFVDDDEGKIGDWREDSGASADDHASFSTLDAVPLLGAFFVGESGVQDRDFITEDLVEVGGDGGCESDFGDKEDGGASGFEN